MTDAERHRRASDLLLDALDRPPAERAAWLDAACAGPDGTPDAALRADLDALLAAHADAEASGDLDRPALPRPDAEPEPGRRLGPWRLLEKIGAGGMGAVYRAERADGQYARTVAVKLLRAGGDDDALAARLAAERQILARLEHPRIARLYEGGVTGDGAPYLAMELVDGVPLTAYADAHGLGVEARLALFLQVCDAVAYAHRHLVVHRDLKPSNLLVTTAGGPDGGPSVKLLDFGIAKLLDDATEGAPLTRTGVLPLTPEYAAPEQVRGGAITTATDVYQLGLVLYELLAGRRAYTLGALTPTEVERAVCERDPPPPSTTGEDRRRLAGDLDTIVLKALAKEPARRYPTVEALAADLRRHLDGLPVHARPATAGYRAGRFVRRHRAGVAAAALVVLALVGGLAASLWQARVARAERHRAEAVSTFLQGMLASADPNTGGRTVTVAEVLDRAAARVDADLTGEPEQEAAVRLTLGTTYQNLGLYEAAEPHLRRALALRQRLLGEHHLETAEARLAVGTFLFLAGRYDEAATELRRAADRYAALGDARGRAAALGQLGGVFNNTGRFREGEAAYREALALLRRGAPEGDAQTGRTLNDLGVLLGTEGDFAAAEPLHREAVAVLRRTAGPRHPETVHALSNLAGALDGLGRYDEAAPAYREALALQRDLLGEAHPNVLRTQISYGNLLWAQGRFAEAEPVLRDALAHAEAALPEGHFLIPYAHVILGQALVGLGRAGEAEGHLRTGLAQRRELLPPDHWLLASTENVLGACLAAQGRFPEAEEILLRTHARLAAAVGAGHEKTVLARRRLAELYAAWDRPEEAARYRTTEAGGR